jgi:hypothetical protein
MSERYSVRTMTDPVIEGDGYRLVFKGWWLFDWLTFDTVQLFPTSEEKEARAICKLLNSIHEEGVSDVRRT